jgi:hypothetical protein
MHGEEYASLAGLRVLQVCVPSQEGLPRAAVDKARPGQVSGRFLRGPVPLSWLGPVCEIPGQKALAVSLAIWYVAGLRDRDGDLELLPCDLERFGLGPMDKSRGLKSLREAGLIPVIERPGKSSLVGIIWAGRGESDGFRNHPTAMPHAIQSDAAPSLALLKKSLRLDARP